MTAKFQDFNSYNADKNQLFEQVKTALEKCNFPIESMNESEGVIQAKAKFNLWSWSEKIVIKIDDNGKVSMKSECSLPTQIIDWGKNKRNVKKFFKTLESLL